ncbi:Uncharacterised protein [Yersinia enterocolitica]|nr:Uncharacterised protein [Yersinia enterocolitica]
MYCAKYLQVKFNNGYLLAGAKNKNSLIKRLFLQPSQRITTHKPQ